MDRKAVYERVEEATIALDADRHTERIDLDEYAVVIALHAERMVKHAKGQNKGLATDELLVLLALAIAAAEHFGLPKAKVP